LDSLKKKSSEQGSEVNFKYFEDTDALHVELSNTQVAETKELNENLYVDLDSQGKVVSLTIEHVKATAVKVNFQVALPCARPDDASLNNEEMSLDVSALPSAPATH
jgi:uncharacterized protein YuzE